MDGVNENGSGHQMAALQQKIALRVWKLVRSGSQCSGEDLILMLHVARSELCASIVDFFHALNNICTTACMIGFCTFTTFRRFPRQKTPGISIIIRLSKSPATFGCWDHLNKMALTQTLFSSLRSEDRRKTRAGKATWLPSRFSWKLPLPDANVVCILLWKTYEKRDLTLQQGNRRTSMPAKMAKLFGGGCWKSWWANYMMTLTTIIQILCRRA